MSFKMRQVRYIECDGCGYAISSAERHTSLDLTYAESANAHGKIVLHFHEADETHDCLRYWMTAPGVMEQTLNEIEMITDRGRAVILKSVGAFRK